MIRRVLRYGDRFFVTIGSTGLALNGLDKPAAFWAEKATWAWACLGLSIVFGICTPFAYFWGRRTIRDRRIAEGHALDFLDSAAEKTNIELRNLSVHIWLMHRTLRTAFRGELLRPISMRVGHRNLDQEVRFSRYRGVVGESWAKNADASKDIARDFEGVHSKTDWDRLVKERGPGYTMHFTFEDFELTKHLNAIIVSPIRRDRRGPVRKGRRWVGCVSADCTKGSLAELENAYPALRKLSKDLETVDLSRLYE